VETVTSDVGRGFACEVIRGVTRQALCSFACAGISICGKEKA
jgi:hypothetical protein